MAWERTGSVQVTHEPMMSADTYDCQQQPLVEEGVDRHTHEILGTTNMIQPVVQSHMIVMTGKRQTVISTARCFWYCFGSS